MSSAVQPRPPVHTHSAESDDASVGQLAGKLSEQVTHLVRDELALAQLEAKRKVKVLGLGAGMLSASGVLALFGAGTGIAAAVLGIAYALPAWLAAVIVAAALFGIAGIAALLGLGSVKRGAPPIPTEAVASAKADVTAARHAVHR